MNTTIGKQSLPASHGRNRVRRQPKDVAFDVVLYLICAILLILILYPLWFIVIASFSDPSAVAGGHVWFVPVMSLSRVVTESACAAQLSSVAVRF